MVEVLRCLTHSFSAYNLKKGIVDNVRFLYFQYFVQGQVKKSVHGA